MNAELMLPDEDGHFPCIVILSLLHNQLLNQQRRRYDFVETLQEYLLNFQNHHNLSQQEGIEVDHSKACWI